MLPSIPFLISILFLFPTLTLSISFTSNSVLFCKCICFGSSTIVPLYLPKDPTHPCLTCTQQFCLDQKFPSCIGAKVGKGDLDTGTGKDGDVESRCFQRDSPKSHFLIVLFIFVTSILLVGALLKQYEIDLQNGYSKNGIKGVVLEVNRAIRNSGSRRGSAANSSYSAMPT